MDLKELYQDIILEHGKSPRNFGKCTGYNHEAKGHNPLCGDQVQVYLKINKNKNVEELTNDQKIKIMSLSGVKQYPMRVKCATLSWHTLVSAMDGKKKDINTELTD